MPHRLRTRAGVLLVAGASVLAPLLPTGGPAAPALAAVEQGPASARPAPRFDALEPGKPARLRERVPVNVVLVGYDFPKERAALSRLRSSLPKVYRPVVRSRLYYRVRDAVGIRSPYDIDVTVASRDYENRFFGRLKELSTRAPLTVYQQDYNHQTGNRRNVRRNHFISAPRTERWLAYHAPRGVDTRENTIYLVNWWGRRDFEHHVYTKIGEADPDTGTDFGDERDSRKITAWGGTTADDEETGLGSTRRVWFHDLSAGPEAFAGSWNVDDADLDEDGEPDYRIPPAWEYGPAGYRPRTELVPDLGRIVRYVALDLLMTTSPLYPVEQSTLAPPTSIDVDANTFEGWPGVEAGEEYIDRRLLVRELREVVPRKRITYEEEGRSFAGRPQECYAAWLADEPCVVDQDLPGAADLFLLGEELRDDLLDADEVDYQVPVLNFSVGTDDPTPLGFADDDWATGDQSYVFNFINPGIVDAGYGLTTTQIHEVGHHLGLSHPHDGYDPGTRTDFGPTGDFYYAWLGDYSNTMMSYVDLNWDFSQFDRDNMARFQAAAYLETANRFAAVALDGKRRDRALPLLRAADRLAARSQDAFSHHRYRLSWALAQGASDSARSAARLSGVRVKPAVVREQRRAAAAAARSTGDLTVQPGPKPYVVDDPEDQGPRYLP